MKFTFPPESRPLPEVTIKRAIHRGGFGEVYYGLTDAGKEVALKLLNQHTDIELRGARACLNLNHPNLVTIYDIKQDGDGDHWIVMEYVGGKRLSDVLEARDRLPVEEIECWLDGITAGLTFLHDRGIVHRDLKPSNVFRENGVIKVGDVGLSKFISESRRSAHTRSVGTVYYMAPEVARGHYGRQVDVYALGIMAYEMFTGDVPFDGESSAEILMKHLSDRPNLDPLPQALRPVIARALEKDPQKRTQTVARLRDEFKAAVRGRQNATVARNNEEPVELLEDSFIDHPRQHGRAKEDSHPVATYAAAARADAQAYAQRMRHRAEDYRHDAQDWAGGQNGRDCCGPRYSHQQRAAVASAFGSGPGGCGRHTRRQRHARLRRIARQSSHRRDCCGGPLAAIKKRPWLIAVGLGGFLLLTRTGRAMLPELMHFSVIGGVIAAYVFLAIVLVRYFTRPLRRSSQTQARTAAATGPPPAQAGAPQYVAAPAARRKKREIPTPATRRKISAWSRASQLTGGWTVAALLTAIFTAVLYFLGFFGDAFVSGGEVMFFGGVVLLGSWLMLGVNKLLEGTGTSGAARRLIQAGVGAATGAGVWFLDKYLMFGSPSFNFLPGREPGIVEQLGSLELTAGQHPSMWGYMVFFGVLMFLAQWWLGSDAYRKKRFSVWRTLLVGFVGYAASVIFPIPTMWGLLWALVIFSVVQLAAPWTPPEERVIARGVTS